MPLLGNIAWGKAINRPAPNSDAISVTTIASVTTWLCGRSVWASAPARPRLRPSVAIWATNSTTSTA
jgi:hypothetical protein